MIVVRPEILTRAQTNLYRNLKRRRDREEQGLFLLEGERLCAAALASDIRLTAAITTRHYKGLTFPSGLPLFEATQTQMEQITDSRSPQGVLCIGGIPEEGPLPSAKDKRTILALDHISDPGNLGTILRSAGWFGVDRVVLSADCVDPYSPKAVRGSMGAICNLRLHRNQDLVELQRQWHAQGGVSVVLHMQGANLAQYDPQGAVLLIVGSEAHGVDPGLLEGGTAVSIQGQGREESLNAAIAASIALWELSRRKA